METKKKILSAVENFEINLDALYGELEETRNQLILKNEELLKYKDLEKENRLHIAPCADGTSIWVLATDCDSDENIVKEDIYLIGFTEYHRGELGEDWFLTKEEAEKALEDKQ